MAKPAGDDWPFRIVNAKRIIAAVDAEIRAAVDRLHGNGFHDWMTRVSAIVWLGPLSPDQRPAIDYALGFTEDKPRAYRTWARERVKHARRRTGPRPKAIPDDVLLVLARQVKAMIVVGCYSDEEDETIARRYRLSIAQVEHARRTIHDDSLMAIVVLVQATRTAHGRARLTADEIEELMGVIEEHSDTLDITTWRAVLKFACKHKGKSRTTVKAHHHFRRA